MCILAHSIILKIKCLNLISVLFVTVVTALHNLAITLDNASRVFICCGLFHCNGIHVDFIIILFEVGEVHA